VILHALKGNQTIPRCFYDFVEYLESVRFTDSELLQLVLNKALARFLQGLLYFPNTHGSSPAFKQALLNQVFGKEVRLA
jgi:hypothetical protein